VLYDFGPNMWERNSASHLANLVERMRILTRSSVSALIDWPRFSNRADSLNTARAAEISHSVVIRVPHGRDMYAEQIHPNAKGHSNIAKRVSDFIASCRRDSTQHNGSTAADVSLVSDGEVCFADRSMPVVEARSWHFVDDGVTSHKFGWTSTVRNARLRMRLPKTESCGSIVSLSYLRTSSSGTFKIECGSTCPCTPMRSYHQATIFPFPLVHTPLRETIKVTETTSFYQLRKTAEECIVDVLHLDVDRVRVDGIYLRRVEHADVHNAANGSNANAAQKFFGRNGLARDCQSLDD
jgi:hypothetical protein